MTAQLSNADAEACLDVLRQEFMIPNTWREVDKYLTIPKAYYLSADAAHSLDKFFLFKSQIERIVHQSRLKAFFDSSHPVYQCDKLTDNQLLEKVHPFAKMAMPTSKAGKALPIADEQKLEMEILHCKNVVRMAFNNRNALFLRIIRLNVDPDLLITHELVLQARLLEPKYPLLLWRDLVKSYGKVTNVAALLKLQEFVGVRQGPNEHVVKFIYRALHLKLMTDAFHERFGMKMPYEFLRIAVLDGLTSDFKHVRDKLLYTYETNPDLDEPTRQAAETVDWENVRQSLILRQMSILEEQAQQARQAAAAPALAAPALAASRARSRNGSRKRKRSKHRRNHHQDDRATVSR